MVHSLTPEHLALGNGRILQGLNQTRVIVSRARFETGHMRTEFFVGGLPGGNYLLKALARIDQIFWPPDLTQTDLVREEEEEREDLAPEELGQEDTAQDDEANLAREEYFRDILRGYSSEARRRLHQLNITGDPRSVLDEEWVQFFRDGLVETTYSGRGGVRSELKELIGKLLGEFQDGP